MPLLLPRNRTGHRPAAAEPIVGRVAPEVILSTPEPETGPNHPRTFDTALRSTGFFPLRANAVQVLQVNVGPCCNLACAHCHVEGGPDRLEEISHGILEQCLRVLAAASIPTVDITGGAPELHPDHRWFIRTCREQGCRVMTRTNLTAFLEQGAAELGRFYRDLEVEIIASLPCYDEADVDAQRGAGVFARSIEALRILNELGYGQEGTGLALNLVFNPGGANLPPDQASLEADYRRILGQDHGVVFTRLLTITNMPLGRFRRFLEARGLYCEYLGLLGRSFNPATVETLMCRTTLSVGWDGALHDCDFNQALGLRCDHGAPDRIGDFDLARLASRRIVTAEHCFGCAAGAGSSCGGALL